MVLLVATVAKEFLTSCSFLSLSLKLPPLSSDQVKNSSLPPAKSMRHRLARLAKGAELGEVAPLPEAAQHRSAGSSPRPTARLPNHPKRTWGAFEVCLLLLPAALHFALDLRDRGAHGAMFRSWWFHLHIRGQNKQIKTAPQNEPELELAKHFPAKWILEVTLELFSGKTDSFSMEFDLALQLHL